MCTLGLTWDTHLPCLLSQLRVVQAPAHRLCLSIVSDNSQPTQAQPARGHASAYDGGCDGPVFKTSQLSVEGCCNCPRLTSSTESLVNASYPQPTHIWPAVSDKPWLVQHRGRGTEAAAARALVGAGVAVMGHVGLTPRASLPWGLQAAGQELLGSHPHPPRSPLPAGMAPDPRPCVADVSHSAATAQVQRARLWGCCWSHQQQQQQQQVYVQASLYTRG